VQEYKDDNGGPATTVDDFYTILKSYIAGHSMEDNQHDLIDCIQSATKPETMKVQTFFYWLKELNDVD
jgi:hypothetical protein